MQLWQHQPKSFRSLSAKNYYKEKHLLKFCIGYVECNSENTSPNVFAWSSKKMWKHQKVEMFVENFWQHE